MVSDADITKAAQLASVTEFVHQLKDGLDTNAGERGGQMSGGQKQRIAIARYGCAVVKGVDVVLLGGIALPWLWQCAVAGVCAYACSCACAGTRLCTSSPRGFRLCWQGYD